MIKIASGSRPKIKLDVYLYINSGTRNISGGGELFSLLPGWALEGNQLQ